MKGDGLALEDMKSGDYKVYSHAILPAEFHVHGKLNWSPLYVSLTDHLHCLGLG